MKLRSQRNFKDTGIPWLGSIPSHWDIKRIKHTTYVKGRIGWQGLKSEEFIDKGPYLITGTDFIKGKVNWDSCYHVSEKRYKEDPYIQLRENDLLITKDGTIGKTAIVTDLPGKATLNSGVFLTRPTTLSTYFTKYLFWVLNSNIFTNFINTTKTGTTISHLYQNVFVEFSFPIPAAEEQRTIATFLDRETERIDSLIKKKQRQIDLLQEKRAALISHVVTKGLNPDVRMKDSGIEWLREIPEHWVIKRLKFVSTLQTGLTLGKRYDNKQLTTRPYLRVANVQDGYLDLDTITEIDLPQDDVARYELKYGDVVMTEGGDFDKLGRGCVWENQIQKCLHQNHIFAVRPDQTVLNPHFLAAMLTSFHGKNYFTITAQQTTNLATTNSNKLRNFPVLLPPLQEQADILKEVLFNTNQITILTNQISSSIQMLREYRTALVSAAVTGKIDVRGEVIT